MNTKPKNLRRTFGVLFILLLLAIFVRHFMIYHPLETVMPDFSPEAVISCQFECTETDVTPPLGVERTNYVFSIEPGSEEFNYLMEMLQGTGYRKQFRNVFNTHTYKITLNPWGSLYLTTDSHHYVIKMQGKQMVMGFTGNNKDFSPKGGAQFQKSIIDYIFENGTLIKKETQ